MISAYTVGLAVLVGRNSLHNFFIDRGYCVQFCFSFAIVDLKRLGLYTTGIAAVDFSLVEADAEQHKRLLLDPASNGYVTLNPTVREALAAQVDDNGNVITREQYVQLRRKLRAVYRAADEAFGTALVVHYDGRGWQAFGTALIWYCLKG